jgi:hypothetical protein
MQFTCSDIVLQLILMRVRDILCFDATRYFDSAVHVGTAMIFQEENLAGKRECFPL